MKEGKIRRVFDLDLKLSLVDQIEKGELRVSDVSRLYRVSNTAVFKWLRKYSDLYGKQTRVIVEHKSLSKKTKELEGRIKELERALGQKQMRVDYLEKIIGSTSERLKEDIEKKYKRP